MALPSFSDQLQSANNINPTSPVARTQPPTPSNSGGNWNATSSGFGASLAQANAAPAPAPAPYQGAPPSWSQPSNPITAGFGASLAQANAAPAPAPAPYQGAPPSWSQPSNPITAGFGASLAQANAAPAPAPAPYQGAPPSWSQPSNPITAGFGASLAQANAAPAPAPDFNALFRKYMGSAFDPNSRMDRRKMQRLQSLRAQGSPLNASSIYKQAEAYRIPQLPQFGAPRPPLASAQNAPSLDADGAPISTLPRTPAPTFPSAPTPRSTATPGQGTTAMSGTAESLAAYTQRLKDEQRVRWGGSGMQTRPSAAPPLPPGAIEPVAHSANLRAIRDDPAILQGVRMQHSYGPNGGRVTSFTDASGRPLDPARQQLMQSYVQGERVANPRSAVADNTLTYAHEQPAPVDRGSEMIPGLPFTRAEAAKLFPGVSIDERPDVVRPYLERLHNTSVQNREWGGEYGTPASVAQNPAYAAYQARQTKMAAAIAWWVPHVAILERYEAGLHKHAADLAPAAPPPPNLLSGVGAASLPRPALPVKQTAPAPAPASALDALAAPSQSQYASARATGLDHPPTAYDLNPHNAYNYTAAAALPYNQGRMFTPAASGYDTQTYLQGWKGIPMQLLISSMPGLLGQHYTGQAGASLGSAARPFETPWMSQDPSAMSPYQRAASYMPADFAQGLARGFSRM